MSTKHIDTAAGLVRFGATVKIECGGCGAARTVDGACNGKAVRVTLSLATPGITRSIKKSGITCSQPHKWTRDLAPSNVLAPTAHLNATLGI